MAPMRTKAAVAARLCTVALVARAELRISREIVVMGLSDDAAVTNWRFSMTVVCERSRSTRRTISCWVL
jgi:hypothetical protein